MTSIGSFALNKSLGIPLRVINNLDGTCTLEVTGNFSPDLSSPPRIDSPIIATQTTPGVEQTLVSYIVPAAKQHVITQVITSCRIEGVASIYLNGALFATQRTSAASPNANLTFDSAYPLASAGDLVETKFISRLNSAQTDVECKLVGYEINI